MQQVRVNTWLSFRSAQPSKVAQFSVGNNTATTLNALPSSGAAGEANAVAAAVGLDLADWWEPTAAGYLNHVSKAQIVQALKEVGPELADDGIGAMKKDVLVGKAASRLAGKRWLPVPLRRPPG